MKQIKRPRLLVDMALDSVRRAIVDGDLNLGDPISEARLAAQMGISTTPVREALALLRREGLVDVVPQRGTFVFTLQPGELDRICELRVALETAALPLAVERQRDALTGRLEDVVARMADARSRGDTPGYLRLDTAFHEQFLAHCDNPYMVDAYGLISAKVAALRNRMAVVGQHLDKSYREHVAVVDAVKAGDLDTANGILSRHIARKDGSYWDHIDEIFMTGKAAETPAPAAAAS